jgi:hypothetical protein
LLPLLVARVLALPWTRRQTSAATRTSSILMMTLLLQSAAAVALYSAPTATNAANGANAPSPDLLKLLEQAQQAAGTLNQASDQVWDDAPPPAKPVVGPMPDAGTGTPATAAAGGAAAGVAEVKGPTPEERRAAIRKVVETAPKGSVFLWTDAEGAVHMTQEAPPESAQRVVVESGGGTFADEGEEPAAPSKATNGKRTGKQRKR